MHHLLIIQLLLQLECLLAVLELSIGVSPGALNSLYLCNAELARAHGSSRRLVALVATRERISNYIVEKVARVNLTHLNVRI